MEFSDGQRQTLESTLAALLQQVEGIEEVACVHQDGTILTHIHSSTHRTQTDDLLREYSQLLEHLTQLLEYSQTVETVCQGEKRTIALYRIHAQWMLGVIGQTKSSGLLQRACRQTAGKLRAFLASSPDGS